MVGDCAMACSTAVVGPCDLIPFIAYIEEGEVVWTWPMSVVIRRLCLNMTPGTCAYSTPSASGKIGGIFAS